MKKLIIIFIVFLSFFCFNTSAKAEESIDESVYFYEIEEDDNDIEYDDYDDNEEEQDYEEDGDIEYDNSDDNLGDDNLGDDLIDNNQYDEESDSSDENIIPEIITPSNNNVSKSKVISGKVCSVIIVLVILFGFYIGWQRGFVKEITDFLALLISMILAGIFKGPLANLLYTVLPFYSFPGSVRSLYSVNIVFYQVILYLLLLLFFLGIYQLIIQKFKLKDKIVETAVEANIVSSILGAVIGGPLIALFVYNIVLFAKLPVFNLHTVNNSKVANLMMKKTFMVSNINKALYISNEYVLGIINSDELKDIDKTYLDNNIITYMVNNNLIDEKKVNKLYDKRLLKK